MADSMYKAQIGEFVGINNNGAVDDRYVFLHLIESEAQDWTGQERLVMVQVRELRKRTDCLPDDYFVVLVGDMITEEALPTYMAMLNTLDGARDETGASPTPWGR